MKKDKSRILLALFIAAIGTLLMIFFNIGPKEIDQFMSFLDGYIIPGLLISIVVGASVHLLFPTRKKCRNCGNTLKGLLSPLIFQIYPKLAKNLDKDKLRKAFYVCKECGNVYSFRVQKLGNIGDIGNQFIA